ncbi:hypothetical protein IGI04_020003 [Brassica rapa subsp. trilocularis]|uniref:Uncharacterized protein n=1 Tax=Brassica rapa subsp. trilocularis TaxID=1813537 RepID=A0ABQ7MKW3_BRACM|nr:hypothetical protein IGI04_020003 [Brassica rapa subsp. trilocularis]
MDKPHIDPNTNLPTEEYTKSISEFMTLVMNMVVLANLRFKKSHNGISKSINRMMYSMLRTGYSTYRTSYTWWSPRKKHFELLSLSMMTIPQLPTTCPEFE